jgi:hypothetical protein
MNSGSAIGIIGGVAVGLLGYSRATADIAMIIEGTGID